LPDKIDNEAAVKGINNMEQYTILIAGRGKLAEELLKGLNGPAISRVIHWEDRASSPAGKQIVAHAGSGRQMNEIIEYCTKTGSILLELSTADVHLPENPPFPLIICPNVNMPMLHFMATVKHASKYFLGQDIIISESHQASKSTKAGTAAYLAKALGIPEKGIKSIRDPEIQSRKLGIPPEFLDRHAYHRIAIKNPGVEIRLETRVLGKSAYASGLSKVIDLLARTELSPGCHDIVDLVVNDMQNS